MKKLKKECIVEKKIEREKVTNSVKRALNIMLSLEANSASCGVVYEPKLPDGLWRFKRKNE